MILLSRPSESPKIERRATWTIRFRFCARVHSCQSKGDLVMGKPEQNKPELFFEDLSAPAQEAIIDLIVSIIRNKRQEADKKESGEDS